MPPSPHALTSASLTEARGAAFREAWHRLGDQTIAGSDWEDAGQAALLAAWRYRHGFQGRCKPSTWLHRIARNSARDVARKHRPTVSLDDVADWLPDPEPNPPAQYERKEKLERIDKALKRLPARLRMTFVLYYGPEQLQVLEIARRLNIGEPAVKSRLLRAREAVQRWLGVEVGRLRK